MPRMALDHDRRGDPRLPRTPKPVRRRGKAATDIPLDEAPPARPPRRGRQAPSNPLFADAEGASEDQAALRASRLAAYGHLLRERMHEAGLDEEAVIRRSLLPAEVVRDALAGRAAPLSYGQFALAEALGLDPEAVVQRAIAAGPAPPAARTRPVRARPAPAEAGQAGSSLPRVTRHPDGTVSLEFAGPIRVSAAVADAILLLLSRDAPAGRPRREP